MTPDKKLLLAPGRTALAGAPEGHDGRILADLARLAPQGLIHVARDDGRAARLARLVTFFAPEVEILHLPAWDCLPYDRVSPHGEVVAQRIDALSRLLVKATGPRLLLTTVNAALQKLPPREMLAQAVFSARIGDRIDLDPLVTFLAGNGYQRTGTVREPGEFAVRGGIIDIFPPGSGEPVRLDLFGDELEAVRRFDPVSQRTTGQQEALLLKPVSEVLLDPDAIARFRTGYRALAGPAAEKDPLYEAVSAGRRHAGMEHWLPLFHSHLHRLFDYAPQAAVVLDHQAEGAVEARLETVVDYYEARKTMAEAGGRATAGAPPYFPVAPDTLFLDWAAWQDALGRRPVLDLSPFAAPAEAVRARDVGGRAGQDFTEARNRQDVNLFDAVRDRVEADQVEGRRVLVAAYSAGSRDRLAGVLRDHGLARLDDIETWPEAARLDPAAVALAVLDLENGFTSGDLTVITEQDILGDRLTRPAGRRRKADQFLTEVSSLAEGDLVVHIDHGIGRYEGLVALDIGGAPHDCLKVVYDGGDKLFVPVENIEVLSRFGSESAGVQLDKLGGAQWQARKAKLKSRLRDMADDLIAMAAQRQLRQSDRLPVPEGVYDEFCARFPYPETDDQLRAIEDTLGDLAAGRPMDRLVCGDVGFGKTEVALRAAFVAALGGQQVAVVVPTTLLARQHYRSFTERMAGLPVRVEQLSRLVPPKAATAVRKGLAEGQVDIVIGTSAVLGKQVQFKNLGLVIVDEEQHFGVRQKERLKQLRNDVHILTLTATPIPRTLQLALSGVREMSLIATPPVDRLAVRTFVLPFDPVVVREAILREHYRGGQTFYVCPRLEELPKVAEQIRDLVPEVKVLQAHGRLSATALENVMAAFYDREGDVLLSTNIVESGLDLPTANTIVIHRADMFGLAQLYQLRGRVGRAKQRGYAYLTLPADQTLSTTAQKRLEVMQTLDSLGAGFTLASHDLDIRGAGNLLGEEQSGHVREVGIELYQHMLEEAVAEARARGGAEEAAAAEEEWTPTITIAMPVLIPEAYVADLSARLGLYRRLGDLHGREELDAFAAELIDRFGPLPTEVENLLQIMAIKVLCRRANAEKVDAGVKGAVVAFRDNRFANPEGLVTLIARKAGTVKLRPDHKLVIRRDWTEPKKRLAGLRQVMTELAEIAEGGPTA